jgi:hypothetical protein
MVVNARDSRWDQTAAKFKARCRLSNAKCWRCIAREDIEHAAIDYSAPQYSTPRV